MFFLLLESPELWGRKLENCLYNKSTYIFHNSRYPSVRFFFFLVGKECDLIFHIPQKKSLCLRKTFPYLVLTRFGLLEVMHCPFTAIRHSMALFLCFFNLVTLSLPQAVFFSPTFFLNCSFTLQFSLLFLPFYPLALSLLFTCSLNEQEY